MASKTGNSLIPNMQVTDTSRTRSQKNKINTNFNELEDTLDENQKPLWNLINMKTESLSKKQDLNSGRINTLEKKVTVLEKQIQNSTVM